MTRLTLLRYGAYAKCSQDHMPLHSLGGVQIQSISDQLKNILTEIDGEDLTVISSKFRPARESLCYLLDDLVYTDPSLDRRQKGNILREKIMRKSERTLPNYRLSQENIRNYMDLEAYGKDHKKYNQQILQDITNCQTKDMICGVHGRTIGFILESRNLKDISNLKSFTDRRSGYDKLNNGQAIVIDTVKNEVLATLLPDVNMVKYR